MINAIAIDPAVTKYFRQACQDKYVNCVYCGLKESIFDNVSSLTLNHLCRPALCGPRQSIR
jgi:hypothetical protein